MNAKIKCKITDIAIKDDSFIQLTISGLNGRVDTKMIPAQECKLMGTLFLKQAAANQIKIGSIIYIDISVQEPEV